jgi:hypothetical protein
MRSTRFAFVLAALALLCFANDAKAVGDSIDYDECTVSVGSIQSDPTTYWVTLTKVKPGFKYVIIDVSVDVATQRADGGNNLRSANMRFICNNKENARCWDQKNVNGRHISFSRCRVLYTNSMRLDQ